LRAPFALGDAARLRALFGEAGIAGIEVRTPAGTARFPSIEAWVHVDVKGWTLADLIDDAQYRTLQKAAQRELAAYVQRDGTVSFPAPAHIATATKG
jgi:hypothetical protein